MLINVKFYFKAIFIKYQILYLLLILIFYLRFTEITRINYLSLCCSLLAVPLSILNIFLQKWSWPFLIRSFTKIKYMCNILSISLISLPVFSFAWIPNSIYFKFTLTLKEGTFLYLKTFRKLCFFYVSPICRTLLLQWYNIFRLIMPFSLDRLYLICKSFSSVCLQAEKKQQNYAPLSVFF